MKTRIFTLASLLFVASVGFAIPSGPINESSVSTEQVLIEAPVAAEKATAKKVKATVVTKAEMKEAKKALAQAKKENNKKARIEANEDVKGDKSQLVAALLAFFLGGLGIHRFYLGYTWQGVVQLLTGGLCGIWSLIDFVRILIGTLKPKGGEYAKTL